MTKKTYQEPEYLKLNSNEKRKIKRQLLIFPFLCLAFILIMLLGELHPESSLISFTKFKYFFKANYIAHDFVTGNIDNIISHNLLYYDTNDINYSLYDGIKDIYDTTIAVTTDAYEHSFKDKPAIALMVHTSYKTGGHFSTVAKEIPGSGKWYCVGYVHFQGEDVLKIEITFISEDVYFLEVEPALPSIEEDASEEEIAKYEEWKCSDIYLKWAAAGRQIQWMKKVLSNQNDMIKNIKNVFKSPSLSTKTLEKYITNMFINPKYIGNQETMYNYQSNLAWLFNSVLKENILLDVFVSVGDYEPNLHGTINYIDLFLCDENNNKAKLTIPCLYTPYGYEIIPTKVVYVHDLQFGSLRILDLIDFIDNDIMPDDLLLQKAADDLTKISK